MTTATIGSRIQFLPHRRERGVLEGRVTQVVTEQLEQVTGYRVKVEGFNYFVPAEDATVVMLP